MVAKEENITKAANLLHVSQPTLSRQLMQMEEELGVKLFHRSKYSIILTEEGVFLKRRAQEISDLAEKTEKELSCVTQNISGVISIGCGETKNMHYLSRWMTSFREKYPDVTFDITTGIADAIKEQMENGMLDFGLMLEPVELNKYNFVRMPLREKWCILVRMDSALADKQKITPIDLIGVPIMMAKRNVVRNELENWLGGFYQQMNVVATCNLSYFNRSVMVQNCVAAALVHEFEPCPSDLRLLPLDPEISNGSVLAWKKNLALTPAVSEFINYTKNVV